MEHEVSENVSFSKKGAAVKIARFRKLGLAHFLLVLIQKQQLTRKFDCRLILQSNPKAKAFGYYQNRGFLIAPNNSLASIPGLPSNPFPQIPLHFVTNAEQDLALVPIVDRLMLFHLDGILFPFPDAISVGVIPTDKGTLFEFPFNCEGKFMEQFTKDSNHLGLFSHPLFGAPSTENYALRDATDQRSYHTCFRENGMYQDVFDTSFLEFKSLQNLKAETSGRLTNAQVDF